MKTTGITDKEKQLLFVVLALAILAAAYFFGFVKLQDQATAIEQSNVTDQAEVDQLQGMVDRQAETVKETEGYKQTIKDIIAKYPVDVPQEKAIYLVQQMEDLTGIHATAINFSMDNLAYAFSGENAPSGMYALLGVPYVATYAEFKDMLKYVTDFEDRTTTPSVTADFDQVTGLLTGTVNIKMFYLRGTDKEYEPVPPTGIESGVPDIFGTLIPTINEDGTEGYGRMEYIIDVLEGEGEEGNGTTD